MLYIITQQINKIIIFPDLSVNSSVVKIFLYSPQGRSSFHTWYCQNIFQACVNFWILFSEDSFNLLLAVFFIHLITANSIIFTYIGCFFLWSIWYWPQLEVRSVFLRLSCDDFKLKRCWMEELVVFYESIVCKKSVVPGLAASQFLQDTGPTTVNGCTCVE